MDPLSALSLAGNVVQFVHFGRKLLSDSRQLYSSSAGALETRVQHELVTSDLQALLEKLRRPINLSNIAASLSIPGTEKNLERIYHEAETLAEEIITRLNELKPKD